MNISKRVIRPVRSIPWLATVAATLAVLCDGCKSYTPGGQLARVAKDWCLTIRASQVLPTYPLIEDLVPGDIFLVQWPIEEQVAMYDRAGFLPLDHHLKRVRPIAYSDFYLKSHGVEDGASLPYVWLFPKDGALTNSLLRMPLAAFPSYNFDVKRGGGLNLALPIQGVPVALSFLRAKSAKGSVILKDARTYGIDQEPLAHLVYEWGRTNREMLAQYAPRPASRRHSHTNFTYLRVVNRVFLVGQVSVSLTSAAAASAKLTGGADNDFLLPSLNNANAFENYTNFLNNLNASVASAAMPGGTLKFSAASERAIVLDEQFPRPLVVGYLAFDIPILANGDLGGAVSTVGRLESKVIRARLAPVAFGADENTQKIRDWITGDSAARRAQLLQWARERHYPYPITTYLEVGAAWRALRKEFVATVLEKNQP